MIRLFVDSSVLFSACYSDHGRSRDLLVAAAKGDVVLVVSQYVLDETRAVFQDKAPKAQPVLELIISSIPFDRVEPSHEQVLSAAGLTSLLDAEDAPILAAARKAKVDLLVSFDRKHLVGKHELEKYIRVPIVTPQEAWDLLQHASLT